MTIADNKGMLPLHVAASRGNLVAARLLVESGGDIDAATTTRRGHSAIYFAIQGSHVDVVDYLLDAGCRTKLSRKCDDNLVELVRSVSQKVARYLDLTSQ